MEHDDDWMLRLRETADRFREAAESTPEATLESTPDPKPRIVKRPYTTPSGATARSVKAKNAYQRVQRKGGK